MTAELKIVSSSLKKATQFKNIQAARAIAANFVLLSHLLAVEKKYGHGFRVLPDAVAWGACGVDLFFVVSGFIMATIAAQEDFRTFVVSRLTRIYPPYWFYSLLVLGVSLVAPDIVNGSIKESPVLWKSFLLIPESTFPLLAVGWTLTHEIYFYAIFAVLLALGGVRPIFMPIWALLCVWIHEIIRPASPILTVIGHPLTLEFIAGVCVGLIVRSGITRFSSYAAFAGGIVLIATFLTLDPASTLVGDPASRVDGAESWIRVFALGLPFAFIVYGINTKQKSEHRASQSVLGMIGDSSYSIYLSHVLVLSALGRVFVALPAHNEVIEFVFVLASIFAANIWGIVSFRFIEQPSLRFLRMKVLSAPHFRRD